MSSKYLIGMTIAAVALTGCGSSSNAHPGAPRGQQAGAGTPAFAGAAPDGTGIAAIPSTNCPSWNTSAGEPQPKQDAHKPDIIDGTRLTTSQTMTLPARFTTVDTAAAHTLLDALCRADTNLHQFTIQGTPADPPEDEANKANPVDPDSSPTPTDDDDDLAPMDADAGIDVLPYTFTLGIDRTSGTALMDMSAYNGPGEPATVHFKHTPGHTWATLNQKSSKDAEYFHAYNQDATTAMQESDLQQMVAETLWANDFTGLTQDTTKPHHYRLTVSGDSAIQYWFTIDDIGQVITLNIINTLDESPEEFGPPLGNTALYFDKGESWILKLSNINLPISDAFHIDQQPGTVTVPNVDIVNLATDYSLNGHERVNWDDENPPTGITPAPTASNS